MGWFATCGGAAELAMTEHTVRAVDADLSQLAGMVRRLGTLCVAQIEEAVAALDESDPVLAEKVIAGEPGIDALRDEIEEKAVGVVARRQPLAGDLREIIGALRIANDLERIGDLAENVARGVIEPDAERRLGGVMTRIQHMAELALAQLRQVLRAYELRDAALAVEVWRSDEEIDTLENSLFRELLTYMMENPRNVGFCSFLLLCSKNLERIGDHATNIAESVYYIVEGQLMSGERPKASLIA
jgi:phosphate transport system protein